MEQGVTGTVCDGDRLKLAPTRAKERLRSARGSFPCSVSAVSWPEGARLGGPRARRSHSGLQRCEAGDRVGDETRARIFRSARAAHDRNCIKAIAATRT